MFPVGAKLMKWKNGGFWDSHPNKPSLDNDFVYSRYNMYYMLKHF